MNRRSRIMTMVLVVIVVGVCVKVRGVEMRYTPTKERSKRHRVHSSIRPKDVQDRSCGLRHRGRRIRPGGRVVVRRRGRIVRGSRGTRGTAARSSGAARRRLRGGRDVGEYVCLRC